MEIDSDNVAEVEKYAFLLGSAIKNEDSEQFFSIYDSIIPKDLPDNQLEDIKDRAREVADLPDGEFNDLVSRARHFSLAPAGTTMSCRRDTASNRWTQPGKDEVVEEDDGICSVGSYRYSSVSSGLPDEPTYYPSAKTRTESETTKKFETDSGVCNSSKASFGSLSDHDGSEDEGRGVSFDYYPPQIKIRSGCGLSLDYDEAHEVKSDHSSPDVNSPRSDISDGIEMTTFPSRTALDDDDDDEFNFRQDTKYQDDFNTSGESEEENSYGKKYYNMGYRPLASYTPTYSSYPNSDVDKGIKFESLKHSTQYSRYAAYQPSSSDRVKIEKSSYKKDPPFGRGPEQLQNVGASLGSLISGVTSDEVKNMPEGRKLAPLTSQEDSKKRKKKKRSGKDDASASTDENGNPLVETRGLTPARYKQMRESPNIGGGTVANHCDSGYGTFSSHDNVGPRPYSSSNHRDTENDAAAKVRRRKKKTEDKKTAEDIENYQGDKSIEELMRFIGGQNESNKKSKKNSPVNEDISTKTQKSNKKSKEKKQKSPTASSSLEEADYREGGGAATTDSPVNQASVDNMGNSSGKADGVDIPNVVENGDIDGLIPHKTDKLSKALLKDNDSVEKSAIHVNNEKLMKGAVICRESVKEKEPSSTNNKRDIVSITGSVDNIIKKKEEKSAKALKADKSEMPASKSEDVLKLDHSIPNSVTVKQKNSKNKKTKPTSPTVKLDNEIHVSVSDMNQQSVLPSFSNETIGQDTFIFTDLDVPQVPKEDEFQLVGKKKKKVTKEMEKIQNNFVTNYSKPSRRHDEKRQVLSHVPNKAAIAQSSPGDDTRVRDLSPSAFPALRQEGRRNSTGDVPIPCVLKSQDDSDLESVKSLPATQGSQTVESILSPRLSYAKMAAGSKVLDSSCSSEKRSSLDSRDSDYDHKKSLWKGSPTERRHSIGSSPEVVNKLAGSPSALTAAASVKAGSQEHIVVDIGIKSVPNSVEVLMPDLGGVDDAELKNHDEDYRVLNKDNSPSENLRTASVSPVVCSQPTVSPVKSLDNSVNSVSNCQPALASKQSPTNLIDTEMNSSSVINRSSSVAISNVHKQETCRCKSSTSSNGRKQKSVIFLDKRVEESPGNLGISFGFEEKDEGIKLSKNEPMEFGVRNDQSDQGMKTSDSNIEHSQTFDFINSADLNLEPKDLVVNDIEKNSSPSSSVISNSSSLSEMAKSSSSNSETSGPIKMVPAQIVRMNGIVAPQGPSSKLSNDVQEVREDISNIAGSEKTVETQHAIPESRLKNEVIVYFGEGVVTLKKDVVVRSLNNGPTSYCGLMRFMEETNLRSNFNVAEAAAFFTREWDRTVQLQDKEPGSVTVHRD